jgi:peptidoglycan/xylan/chitin deacetylase (PgdA/CDA1 family)
MELAVPNLIRRGLKRSAYVADSVRPPRPGVVVLIYHRVGAASGLEVDLPLDRFRAQMALLASSGRVRTLDTALEELSGDPPEASVGPPIVITFDDGTADFADAALPVLIEHQLPVTLYVSTDFVDRGRPFPHDGTPLSWPALAEAQATGLVTVGSHTHTHALLDRLSENAIAEELDRADDLIADHLGVRPQHFAYPKAVPGSGSADAAVRRRYRSAALAGTRPNPYGRTDPFRLSRSPIQVSDAQRYFLAKIAGGMALEDSMRTMVNRWRYHGTTG